MTAALTGGTCNSFSARSLWHELMGVCGVQIGQATTIHHWVYEDGTEGGPASAGAELPESTERPSDEELSRAGHSHLGLLFSCGIAFLQGLFQQGWMCC